MSQKKSRKINNNDNFNEVLLEFQRYKIDKISFKNYIDNLFVGENETRKLKYVEQIFTELLEKNNDVFYSEDDDEIRIPRLVFIYSLHSYGVSSMRDLQISKCLIYDLSFDEVYLLVCHEFAHLLNYTIQYKQKQKMYNDDHGKEFFKIYKRVSNKTREEINLFERSLDEKKFPDILEKFHYTCCSGHSHFSSREIKKCTCGVDWSTILARFE